MNSLINGSMGLSNTWMAVLNTFAFAPVPLSLYFFNIVKKKKGVRFAFQTSLVCFSVCILSFFFGSTFIMGDNTTAKVIIGIVGGVVGSWAIGSFFLMPLFVPSSIASIEEKLAGKNHSAMFFAVQAFVTSVVGAISGNLVFGYIRQLFISTSANGVKWANNFEEAALKFGVDGATVFNLGNLLVPFIVSFFCILGFIACFFMPKFITPKSVAKQLHLEAELELHPELISREELKLYDEQNIGINIALSIFSAFIFDIIWGLNIIRTINKISKTKTKWYHVVLVLIPIVNTVVLGIYDRKLTQLLQGSVKIKTFPIWATILGSLIFNIPYLVHAQEKLNAYLKTLELLPVDPNQALAYE
jgi:hypothetical protein